MTATPFRILRSVRSAVVADCEARRPDEACGLLLADGRGRVVEAVAVANVWPDVGERVRRFLIDPLAQLRVERAADMRGLMLVGFYHSHPEGPAIPSEFDLGRAWPRYNYVIVGLSDGEAVEFRSWGLDDAGAFVEHAVAIED